MGKDVSYHRTFLPDGPFESECRASCHGNSPATNRIQPFEPAQVNKPRDNRLQPFEPNLPPGYKPLQPFTPGQPFQSADMRDKGKPYFRSQRRRAAFKLVNGQLKQTYIVEKIDQQFTLVSTIWELENSELTRDGAGRFAPVVNADYEVIGHVGAVRGDHMIKLKGSNLHDSGYGSLQRHFDADEPVFVSRFTVPNEWEKYSQLYPMAIFTVLTGIDGEVISGDITDSMPGAISVDGPVEYIASAVGILKLGTAIVGGVVKSLIRRAVASSIVKNLTGPTKKLIEGVLAKRAAKKAAQAVAIKNSYNPIAGITTKHHQVFVGAAQETELVIVVRHTNPKSIPLIDKGCPGKPKNLEFINTSPESGIVMANTTQEVLKAQRLGYWVVNQDAKTAARFVKMGDKEVAETMTLKSPFWKVEKGQVIDPKLQKPIVGDYDLMGVIDPKNPGQVIGLVAKNGEPLTDVTNPIVQRAAKAVNGHANMDIPRVLHGPQDFYKGFRKGASAYMPDGSVRHFASEDEVRAFYESMKRQPRAGSYPRPSPNTPVVDELAIRRAAKEKAGAR